MTGKQLLEILKGMSEEQLSTHIEVHDHQEGEWHSKLDVEYSENHGHIDISIKF